MVLGILTGTTTEIIKKSSLFKKLSEQKYLILLIMPGLIYYLIFQYVPMYGMIIAFKKFDIVKGILGSPWVGLKYFEMFISGPYLFRLIKNTFSISFYSLLWGFPAPIIFALLLNELKSIRFKKLVQTISYLPHFISLVIIIGILKQLCSPTTGVINAVIQIFGGQPINFFQQSRWFRTLFISSSIWQGFGWGAIIYIAALTNIDMQLYEAARMDGAGRWRCMWHITLPGIAPTITILLILRLGDLLSVGYKKIILMYNPGIYEVSDVVNTYVYRSGIQNQQFSYASAVGMMNSVISFILIIICNSLSRKVSETSLW